MIFQYVLKKLYIYSMSRKRIYPKTSGYWVYAHTTQNGLYYIGMSKTQPCERWRKSHYKTSVLAPYIKQYGWENIQHKVLIDGLTKEQAEQWEDKLIMALSMNGLCINENRSGGIERDDIKGYMRQYNSTPEGKIYYRVSNYNNYHPNKAIETPAEAKRKYLDFGYIPNYIKHDDLV